MKLKVPFVKNETKWKGNGWCGPIALASLLRYYKDYSKVEEITKGASSSKRKGKEENAGGTSPEGLVYFCLSRGFKVDFIKNYRMFSYFQKGYSKRFRKFLIDFKADKYFKSFNKKLLNFKGYNPIVKNPSLNDIKKYLDSKKPVLLYLNIAVPCNVEKLWPHYVLVVGYDSENIFVHNIYPKNKAYQKIPLKLFLRSWKSDGLNDVLIIPYR